jgi:putative OPT family oligopeptide transporter
MTKLKEITFRAIILGIILTVILAAANTYLALKLGMLTSASIPAALLSIGILGRFKNSNMLENNIVQTMASAGEAIAGGITYTIPALVLINYWQKFDFCTNFFIALSGGVLGVLFSIPLRKTLVSDPHLKFPEGRAIAEILKTSKEKVNLYILLKGGLFGAAFEFLQTGLHIFTSEISSAVIYQKTLWGFAAGFSVTMFSAGFLMGFDMAASILIGAVINWLIALPVLSHIFPSILDSSNTALAAMHILWDTKLRYLGIGAMLGAGVWTFVLLIRPLMKSMRLRYRIYLVDQSGRDKDLPLTIVMLGIVLLAIFLAWFLQSIIPLEVFMLNSYYHGILVFGIVFYIVVIGFIFSVITAYFSAIVGVSASPGSSIVIAGILCASWCLLHYLLLVLDGPLTPAQIKVAEIIVIIANSIVTGIAAIANDNSQDLKVGHLLGATPWKQQLMLLLGVLVSALVIPPIMQLLFDVYGFADILPHDNMSVASALPAPVPSLLAAMTKAMFSNVIDLRLLFFGVGIIIAVLVLHKILRTQKFLNLSAIGVAMGMYLPLTISLPIFFGGLTARHLRNSAQATKIACGLITGSALMSVLLTIPFAIYKDVDILSVVQDSWHGSGVWLSIMAMVGIARFMKRCSQT